MFRVLITDGLHAAGMKILEETENVEPVVKPDLTPEQLVEELAERPYVLVGFLAWLILVPLGITSAQAIRRKLGKNWRRLHKLTYAVAVLGWLHLLWLSRSDVGDAVIYGGLFVFLLGYRLAGRIRFAAP